MMFSTIDTRKLKICIVTVAALFLAACQTTGLKPGAIETGFPPSDWVTERKGNKIFYLCPKTKCKSPQGVAAVPLKIRGDAEAAIRQNVLSAELFDAAFNFLEVASKRAVSSSPHRKIETRTYTGFEHMMTFKDRRGRRIYVAIRDIIQKDRGVFIAGFSRNKGVARRNLRRYLTQTTIRRVN
ncbi:hypothetical protein [Stappia sp. ES.058]|uniref:hypothetical protein n=1 Tax=Stappia sp. ES.058 TaxID=1881061 RepID=UPI00087A3C0E|nr:hypothetical protein [Stappia sp. ES.058]SDU23017.1 hypothetical protein SAMN05428979_2412 [Stappia sp. ES.058]